MSVLFSLNQTMPWLLVSNSNSIMFCFYLLHEPTIWLLLSWLLHCSGNLTSIYYEQGNLEMAINHYKQAIARDAGFLGAYNNLVSFSFSSIINFLCVHAFDNKLFTREMHLRMLERLLFLHFGVIKRVDWWLNKQGNYVDVIFFLYLFIFFMFFFKSHFY